MNSSEFEIARQETIRSSRTACWRRQAHPWLDGVSVARGTRVWEL